MTMSGIEWDSRVLELDIDGRKIHVPYMQASLLSCLLERSDRYVSAGYLGEYLYGNSPDGKTSERVRVGSLIHLLRGTLEGSGLSIHNKYGAGYRMVMATAE